VSSLRKGCRVLVPAEEAHEAGGGGSRVRKRVQPLAIPGLKIETWGARSTIMISGVGGTTKSRL